MHLLAPAKINLHLRVGRRRDDGFHPLLSWMCTVGLFDRLTLEADAAMLLGSAAAAGVPLGAPGEPPLATTRTGKGTRAAGVAGTGQAGTGDAAAADAHVELVICGDCDRPDLPRDGRNLVVRIATAFVGELRRQRLSARDASQPPPRPAFRQEGFQGPHSPMAARAAADGGEGSTASAGAAPTHAPGTAREDPAAAGDGRAVGDPAVRGQAGSGAGAVRGAEGSGRSIRRDDGAAAGGAPQPSPALRVLLDKRIPVGAGLGGGSSDAAHTLVALDRMLSAGWPVERLAEFSARFGSDVPFLVHAAKGSPSAACRGRGEVVRPVARPAARWAVVYSPPFGLATRDVYARFDEMGLGFDGALAGREEPRWEQWARMPAYEMLGRLVNDLEAAAFSLSPELAALREALERDVGRVVRMSGSGSSLFTLFDAGEEDAAREAAEAGRRRGAAAVVTEVAPVVAPGVTPGIV